MDQSVPSKDGADNSKRKGQVTNGTVPKRVKVDEDEILDFHDQAVSEFDSWERPTLPHIDTKTYALGLFIYLKLNNKH